MIGCSNIYDLLNYKLQNQPSKNPFWIRIFNTVKVYFPSYKGWYSIQWNDREKGLFRFIETNKEILGGNVDKSKKHPKFKPNEKFSDEGFYICFKQFISNEGKLQDDKLKHNSNEDIDTDFHEGDVKQVILTKYERNSTARKKCIEYFGYKCAICGIDFNTVYGEIGMNFIHVHHKIPLNKIIEEKRNINRVNPEKDLITICPNCHEMIHKLRTIGDEAVEELKMILKRNTHNQ